MLEQEFLARGAVRAVPRKNLDRVHQSVRGQTLVPAAVLNRFTASGRGTGRAPAPDARFPRMWSATRLYLQNLCATLESGRWHSAARLSLVPFVAALSAGSRRSA